MGSLPVEAVVEADLEVGPSAAGTRALALPLAFALGLAAFTFIDPVRQNATLVRTFAGAASLLLVWNAMLLTSALRSGRTLALEVVLRKQHYLQACAQGSVLLYWGWYWRQVYDSAHLIAAQLLFAYAFDMLLSWSRRDAYTLGFGPVPCHLQHQPVPLVQAGLVLPAVPHGGARLRREGTDPLGQRRPARPHLQPVVVSARACFRSPCSSRARSDITWGQDIASTQFYPPHMYLMLFLIGLPGQFFFGVTTMTMSAVVTTYLFGLAVLRGDGHLFFLRFVYSDCRLPRDAPALHRSVHVAAHRAGTHHLRRALRAQHGRVVFAAGQRGTADVLRQASAGSAPEPVDQADRSRGAVETAAGLRSRRRSADRWRRASATWRTCRSGRSCLRR